MSDQQEPGISVRGSVVSFSLASLGKMAFVIALFIWGVFGALRYEAFNFLHGPDLLIHEFGHLLFTAFGETLMVLGGSLFQLMVPVAFMMYFLLRRQYYSAAVVLFWVVQNFFDIAVYIADSRALELPLVSMGAGDEVIHDWNYLLAKWNVLIYDLEIARGVRGVGWCGLLAFLVAGVYFSFTNALPRRPERREVRTCKFDA